MKQLLKELFCIFFGHDFTEIYRKYLGQELIFEELTCEVCGEKKRTVDKYWYRIEYITETKK